MKNIECPLCEGKGILINKKSTNKYLQAKELKDKGLTLREIAKVMKMKSHTTVFYYLNQYKI